MLLGQCGAGKSTYARALWPGRVVDVDAHRERISSIEDPNVTRRAFAAAYRQAERRLTGGQLVVFDSTGVTPAVRRRLREIAHRAQVPAHLVIVDVPDDVAAKRNAARARPVSEPVRLGILAAYRLALVDVEDERWDGLTIARF